MELLHTMFRQELRPDSFTLSATISACANSGNWQLAVDLLECMDDWRIPANGICLTAAISACRASAQWQLACDLLQRVALHGFVFDELACTASMGACGQASQWQRATQLLPWLQGYCLQQSEFVFGAAVGACAKGQASAFSTAGHEKDTKYNTGVPLKIRFLATTISRRPRTSPGFRSTGLCCSPLLNIRLEVASSCPLVQVGQKGYREASSECTHAAGTHLAGCGLWAWSRVATLAA